MNVTLRAENIDHSVLGTTVQLALALGALQQCTLALRAL